MREARDAPGPRRSPTFSPEALALFIELEAMSRRDPRFEEGAHELARKLRLVAEWRTVNSVLGRSATPCLADGMARHTDWVRCRAVRLALLDAANGLTMLNGG